MEILILFLLILIVIVLYNNIAIEKFYEQKNKKTNGKTWMERQNEKNKNKRNNKDNNDKTEKIKNRRQLKENLDENDKKEKRKNRRQLKENLDENDKKEKRKNRRQLKENFDEDDKKEKRKNRRQLKENLDENNLDENNLDENNLDENNLDNSFIQNINDQVFECRIKSSRSNFKSRSRSRSRSDNLFVERRNKKNKQSENFNEPNINNRKSNYRLIHIGKTGGTYVREILRIHQHHLVDFNWSRFEFNKKHKYIIWIRNPLTRFVSAYNYTKCLINMDISKLEKDNLTVLNSLEPIRIKKRIETGAAYSSEYDKLINYFNSANHLAESLTSDLLEERTAAISLMNSPIEHIYKGIGFYLDNGEFIKKYYKNIFFVGRMEHMKKDFDDLKKIDIKTLDDFKGSIRKQEICKYDIQLTYKAIKNLIDFYKDSDYRALRTLYKYKFIDKETLDSYYKI